MLRGCCDSIRSSVSSSVIELETLKVRVSEALWLLSVFPTPTEVIAEASEASVVTKDLWVPMALLGNAYVVFFSSPPCPPIRPTLH